MTKEEFIRAVTSEVNGYLNNWDRFDHNPQLRVVPADLNLAVVNGSDMLASIADSDEELEAAAHAEGAADADAGDYQATRNPDFYPVKKFIATAGGRRPVPDEVMVAHLADKYFNA